MKNTECIFRLWYLYSPKKGHNAAIQCLTIMMDSRRIISADRDGLLCVWLAESGTLLQTIQGPSKSLAATNNMKFAVRAAHHLSYFFFSLIFAFVVLFSICSSYFLGYNIKNLVETISHEP